MKHFDRWLGAILLIAGLIPPNNNIVSFIDDAVGLLFLFIGFEMFKREEEE